MSSQSNKQVFVNHLPLPKLMVDLIEEGLWKKNSDTRLLRNITKINNIETLDFLSIDGMRQESSGEHLFESENLASIYGVSSSKRNMGPITDPNFMDVNTSVLFAININEEALCLDYRTSIDDPRVVAGIVSEDGIRWRTVTEDFTSFVKMIGLSKSENPD